MEGVYYLVDRIASRSSVLPLSLVVSADLLSDSGELVVFLFLGVLSGNAYLNFSQEEFIIWSME